MARRTGPSPRIKLFARELAAHPLLLDAILKAVGEAIPAALEHLEAEAQAKAAAGLSAAPEPPTTHWQRLAATASAAATVPGSAADRAAHPSRSGSGSRRLGAHR